MVNSRREQGKTNQARVGLQDKIYIMKKKKNKYIVPVS